MKFALGTPASAVSPECKCTFDAVSLRQSELSVINRDCPEHGIVPVKAYHKKMTGEDIDDATALEIMWRDTPEEYE